METTAVILFAIITGLTSLPIPTRKAPLTSKIDYSILTACESNIQQICIEVHGTAKKILEDETDNCDVEKLIECFKFEKTKKECTVDDTGTVAYVDAFIKNADTTRCMDKGNFTEVQELFQFANPDDLIEYTNAHRTDTSGDRESFHYQTDDSERGDGSASGSGESEAGSSGHGDHSGEFSSGSMQLNSPSQ